MRILLLGDYSNVHATLSQGFKALGHECVVASDGDHWKNYPRDIDLKREFGFRGNTSFLWRLLRALPQMHGFDVVQLVNAWHPSTAICVATMARWSWAHSAWIIIGRR